MTKKVKTALYIAGLAVLGVMAYAAWFFYRMRGL